VRARSYERTNCRSELFDIGLVVPLVESVSVPSLRASTRISEPSPAKGRLAVFQDNFHRR